MESLTRNPCFRVSILFLLISAPASSDGGEPRSDFGTIAEGLTAASLQGQIEAHQRMFTLSILSEACRGAGKVSKLVTIHSPVILTAGKWFSLSRLAIVAVDGSGHLVRAVPISIEAENKNPPLFNWDPEKRADSTVLPLRTGSFRFRARTICPADAAIDTLIPAFVNK